MTCLGCTLAVFFLLSAPNPQPGAGIIVFMGDSITDGNTYPQLVRQALAEAGKPVPRCVNAGVASDTAALMRKRLQRDVLVHHPTRVTLSAGVNDAVRKVEAAAYEADIVAIADRLKADKIELILLTPSIVGPRFAEAEKRIVEYDRRLHEVARRYHLRLAEVFALMKKARATGKELLETDQIHPNYEGQRVLARAVLDALGHADVPVPAELKVEMLPGVVRQWRMRPSAGGKPLTAAAVAALKPGPDWKTITLPEKTPAPSWWLDHERQRGFAVTVDKQVGPGRLVGVAEVDSPRARTVYLNTGAQLEAVWLNGKQIFKSEGWTGWHAGKERLRAELRPGRNVIIIETAGVFFLSLTDDNHW